MSSSPASYFNRRGRLSQHLQVVNISITQASDIYLPLAPVNVITGMNDHVYTCVFVPEI